MREHVHENCKSCTMGTSIHVTQGEPISTTERQSLWCTSCSS